MRFRKKPVIVEAEQWFPGKDVAGVRFSADESRDPFVVTIHNQHAFLRPGDWVITEPDGDHHYPCKPEIFAATYEPVEQPANPERGDQ